MNTADDTNDNPELTKLVAEIEQRRSKLNGVIRELAAARAEYYTTGQPVELRERMITLEQNARTLENESKILMDNLQELAGIPDELIEMIEDQSLKGDYDERIYRRQLTRDELAPTDNCEDFIAPALEAIYGVVDKKWLEIERSKPYRLGEDFLNSPFSLVRGARVESEYPIPHRFAQAILVSEDFLTVTLNTTSWPGRSLYRRLFSLA